MGKEQETQPPAITLEEVVSYAKELLLQDGQLVPTVIVAGSRQNVGVLIELAETHQQRLDQMYGIGIAVADGGRVGQLQQAFLISEAWMSRRAKDYPFARLPEPDPNPKEVLVISHLHLATGKTAMVTLEQVRDEAGKLVELVNQRHTTSDDKNAQGTLLLAFVAGFTKGIGGTLH